MSKELAVRNSNTALVPMDELLFDPGSPEVEEGFVVNSLDKATWCAQRYIAAVFDVNPVLNATCFPLLSYTL